MNTSNAFATANPILESATKELKPFIKGQLLFNGDDQYDESRKVWNGMIDRRPSVIVRCQDSKDVALAILFAAKHQVTVAIRGGGHSLPGHSVCDNGLVIDLSA